MRPGFLFLVVCLCGGLRSFVACAHAAEAEGRPAQPRVQVQIDPCVDVDRAQAEKLLAIELAAELVPAGPTPPGTVQARAECAERGVELRVDDPITGKSLRRTIDLARAAPAVRPRLLALALAELTFTSWTELLFRMQPTAPEPVPAAPAEVPEVALRAARQVVREKLPPPPPSQPPPPGARLHLVGAGSVMALFAGTGALWGGGLRAGGDHARHLGWNVDVLVHHGTAQSSLGELSTDVVSAAACFLFHGRVLARRAVSIDLRAGGGVRGGAVRLAGSPQPGSVTETGAVVWGPYAGPLIQAGGSLRLPRHILISISVEGGYVAAPVGGRVDGARTIAVEGPWLGVHLGIGGGT